MEVIVFCQIGDGFEIIGNKEPGHLIVDPFFPLQIVDVELFLSSLQVDHMLTVLIHMEAGDLRVDLDRLLVALQILIIHIDAGSVILLYNGEKTAGNGMNCQK